MKIALVRHGQTESNYNEIINKLKNEKNLNENKIKSSYEQMIQSIKQKCEDEKKTLQAKA